MAALRRPGTGVLFVSLLCACAPDAESTASSRAALAPNQSQLWGAKGELFVPTGRLMDWSYAGYRAGELAVPVLAPTLKVTDFGAKPDDSTDDTAAFTAALTQAVAGDVVQIPAGVFVIKKKLTLKSGVVLQGSGSDKTILDVPVSLTDAYGNPGLDAGGTSTYSFSSAFIEAKGSDGGVKLASITAKAQRGDKTLSVDTTLGIEVGAWVQIEQTDVNGALIKRLHADLMEGGTDNVGDKGTDFYTRVSAVGANSIDIERELPVDVELGWIPTVKSVKPKTSEVGVEHLAVRFPTTTYPGHFKEPGYNAIHFSTVEHSWVRDVRIVNPDYGVNVTGSHFVTVEDVTVESTNARSGHHVLNNGHGGDNLFVGFDIKVQHVHDLTNEWYATGVVFSQGRGTDLSMDHHRSAPYLTLWTELDCGAGTRAWKSGGASNRGPHTAAYDTMWNVTAGKDMLLPQNDFGPRMNFVGFRTAATTSPSPYDWWLETIAPEALDPPNLWLAMRERRLGSGAAGAGGAPSDAAAGGAAGEWTASGGAGAGGSVGTGAASAGGAPSGTGGASAAPADDEGGCGCRTRPSPRGAALWLLGAAMLLALRRRLV